MVPHVLQSHTLMPEASPMAGKDGLTKLRALLEDASVESEVVIEGEEEEGSMETSDVETIAAVATVEAALLAVAPRPEAPAEDDDDFEGIDAEEKEILIGPMHAATICRRDLQLGTQPCDQPAPAQARLSSPGNQEGPHNHPTRLQQI